MVNMLMSASSLGTLVDCRK